MNIHMTNPLSMESIQLLPLQAPLSMADVLHLELRSLNAWPAPDTRQLGGWAVRAAGGYTKRANSANAIEVRASLDAILLREIEQTYSRIGQPCIFRISPLADPAVDELLQARGYQVQDPSFFMRRIHGPADSQWQSIEVQPHLSAAWLDGVCTANGLQGLHQARHRTILETIAGPCCGYGSLQRNGQTVAWGLAVLEHGSVGFYDVVVAPAARGQGLGRQLMQGLLKWAAEQGAVSADLQVTGSNTVAQALYASLGFERVYGYHYRIAEH